MGYTFIFLLGWIIGLLTGLTERLSDKIKKNRKGEWKMTELDLYKFCEDKEMDWRGDQLIIWLYFDELEGWTNLIGHDHFVEGGQEVALLAKCVAFDLCEICEDWEIDPERILKKGE
ncbi:hypothetical protein PDN19_28550 [Bacillus cereus]|nr:hypothetical protein [Bacillus cereus]